MEIRGAEDAGDAVGPPEDTLTALRDRPDQLADAEGQQREVERPTAEDDQADDGRGNGTDERREPKPNQRRPVPEMERDRHGVGTKGHEHGRAEADQPHRVDQEVQAEGKQAEVEGLLRQEHLIDVLVEGHQARQHDQADADDPESAPRPAVAVGRGAQRPDELLEAGSDPAELVSDRNHAAGVLASLVDGLCPSRRTATRALPASATDALLPGLDASRRILGKGWRERDCHRVTPTSPVPLISATGFPLCGGRLGVD